MCVFFFFKQKTAYEVLRSLVGSEMCIRDSVEGQDVDFGREERPGRGGGPEVLHVTCSRLDLGPVSYTHLTLPTIYSV